MKFILSLVFSALSISGAMAQKGQIGTILECKAWCIQLDSRCVTQKNLLWAYQECSVTPFKEKRLKIHSPGGLQTPEELFEDLEGLCPSREGMNAVLSTKRAGWTINPEGKWLAIGQATAENSCKEVELKPGQKLPDEKYQGNLPLQN